LYSSPDIILQMKSMRMRWAGHVASMGNVLVGKSEGKRPLGRPRSRWQDGIRMVLMRLAGGCGVDSVSSGYEQVGFCECGDEP
jgi:hypothetical protein